MSRKRFIIDITPINEGVFNILHYYAHDTTQNDCNELVGDFITDIIYKISKRQAASGNVRQGVKHYNVNTKALFYVFTKQIPSYKDVDYAYEHCTQIIKFIVDELDYLLQAWCLVAILDGELIGSKLTIDAITQ